MDAKEVIARRERRVDSRRTQNNIDARIELAVLVLIFKFLYWRISTCVKD